MKVLDNLVYTIVQPCLDYIRDEAVETAPTEDQCLLVGMLRILKVCLNEIAGIWSPEHDKK
jgi:hypothetical protein